MQGEAIPTPEIKSFMTPEVQTMRRRAPEYLTSLIQEGVLENISQLSDIPTGGISVLGGGELSAVYLIKNNEVPLIVKFRAGRVEDEAEWLSAWKKVGASVPDVKAVGVVSSTSSKVEPTKYLVLEAFLDSEGKPMPTADEFIKEHPERAAELGAAMGEQLSLMHQAKTDKPFGGYEEAGENSLLNSAISRVNRNREYLKSLGLKEEELELLVKKLETTDFPTEGTYIHTDFGGRNTLIESVDPLKIRIFDPNPMIGDPYNDVARCFYIFDYRRAMSEADPDNEDKKQDYLVNKQLFDALLKAYQQKAGEEIDNHRLSANLVLRLINVMQMFDRKLKPTGHINSKEEQEKYLEHTVRQGLFIGYVHKLLY